MTFLAPAVPFQLAGTTGGLPPGVSATTPAGWAS